MFHMASAPLTLLQQRLLGLLVGPLLPCVSATIHVMLHAQSPITKHSLCASVLGAMWGADR